MSSILSRITSVLYWPTVFLVAIICLFRLVRQSVLFQSSSTRCCFWALVLRQSPPLCSPHPAFLVVGMAVTVEHDFCKLHLAGLRRHPYQTYRYTAQPTDTATFFPLKATPYLKIDLIPLVTISSSYLLSLICFKATSASWLSFSWEQCFSAFSSIKMPGREGVFGMSWIS